MKKFWVVAGVGLIAIIPLKAGFEDIGQLIAIVTNTSRTASQAAQIYSQGQVIYQQGRDIAAFVQSPAALKQAAINTLTQIQTSLIARNSNGADPITVATYDKGLESAQMAAREISNAPSSQMTTENAALSSLMQLEAIRAKQERDKIQAHLQFQEDVKRYAQTEGYSYVQ